MKRLIIVWLDGGITSSTNLAEINPAYIANGNITAIIDLNASSYLNLDNGSMEEWLELPAIESKSA